MPTLPEFGSSLPEIVVRTAIIYRFLAVAIRHRGKREVGQMSVLERVAILVISDAAELDGRREHHAVRRDRARGRRPAGGPRDGRCDLGHPARPPGHHGAPAVVIAPGRRAPRQASWSIVFAVACVLAVLVTACAAPGAPGTRSATTSVLIGGTTWHLLPAGPDGMRGRADFDGADGMLFDLGQDTDPSAVQFVMDGVAIDLDIAWFAADGALVGTMSMPACVAEPCPRFASPGRFRWAVETPVGAFRHLDAGARLDLEPGQES